MQTRRNFTFKPLVQFQAQSPACPCIVFWFRRCGWSQRFGKHSSGTMGGRQPVYVVRVVPYLEGKGVWASRVEEPTAGSGFQRIGWEGHKPSMEATTMERLLVSTKLEADPSHYNPGGLDEPSFKLLANTIQTLTSLPQELSEPEQTPYLRICSPKTPCTTYRPLQITAKFTESPSNPSPPKDLLLRNWSP